MSSSFGRLPRPDRMCRPRSLALRLAVTTTISAFAILAALVSLTYWGIAGHLRGLNSLYLHDELKVAEILVRSEDYRSELMREIETDHGGDDYVKHAIRLQDRTGATVIETPGMKDLLPAEIFPAAARRSGAGDDRTWTAPDGSIHLLTSVRADVGKAGGDWGNLQVALDVTNVEYILVTLRKNLIASLLAGVILCLAAGLAVARQGTRPLREITSEVTGISASRLSRRISGSSWPSELESLAAALNGMLERLEDSFARLSNSATNLAHKLRTPLTILRGEAEVALSAERTPDELRDVLESSLEEYGRISHMTDNILFLARAETGKFHAVPVSINACEEIAKVAEYYEPVAEEKKIGLSCHGEMAMIADPVLFRRAVANLVSNAITYTPQGGNVSVTATTGADGSVTVTVTDSGPGIPGAEFDKIFDLFYRVYSTRFMDPGGSGLGLAVVKAIMDLHNGSISLTSAPGEGTTAILSFPSAC
jgi:two-component system, OmpR family, heavy metal sensor histidine kinase CusS